MFGMHAAVWPVSAIGNAAIKWCESCLLAKCFPYACWDEEPCVLYESAAPLSQHCMLAGELWLSVSAASSPRNASRTLGRVAICYCEQRESQVCHISMLYQIQRCTTPCLGGAVLSWTLNVLCYRGHHGVCATIPCS